MGETDRVKEVNAAVHQRDGKVCQYCGIVGLDFYIVEHVIPRSKNGPTEMYNLVVACVPCNRRKYNRVWVPNNIDVITYDNPEWRRRIEQSAIPFNQGKRKPVYVPMKTHEVEAIDRIRGKVERSAFIREVLLTAVEQQQAQERAE